MVYLGLASWALGADGSSFLFRVAPKLDDFIMLILHNWKQSKAQSPRSALVSFSTLASHPNFARGPWGRVRNHKLRYHSPAACPASQDQEPEELGLTPWLEWNHEASCLPSIPEPREPLGSRPNPGYKWNHEAQSWNCCPQHPATGEEPKSPHSQRGVP